MPLKIIDQKKQENEGLQYEEEKLRKNFNHESHESTRIRKEKKD